MVNSLPITSTHLWQPTRYKATGGPWRETFWKAVADAPDSLTWDVGALLSIIGLNYPLGDRTLFREISRQPWLSRLTSAGEVELEAIPPHAFYWLDPPEAARLLRDQLFEEVRGICATGRPIYLLLSGGLDSRIIAGVLALAGKQGLWDVSPRAITWGIPECRDVHYAQLVARNLGLPWERIDLGPADLLKNVRQTSLLTGALVSPIHLHRMDWFENADENAIVVAGSYGDSVGRAEFSGLHVLDIPSLNPVNAFNLLAPEYLDDALALVEQDLQSLANRASGSPPFVLREHERQGHYMRNTIAHAMSVIDHYRPVYQMFTSREVYGAMWSLHPAARTKQVYAELLEELGSGLANLPWARTNRALRGAAREVRNLPKEYHDYPRWTSDDLFLPLTDLVDAAWFDATGVFDGRAVRRLIDQVRRDPQARGKHGSQPHERFLWLAAVRTLVTELAGKGKTVRVAPPATPSGKPSFRPASGWSLHKTLWELRRALLNRAAMKSLQNALIRQRHQVLRRASLKEYPPVRGTPPTHSDR